MFKKRILLFGVCLGALCLHASPTMAAPLFDFHFGSINSSYTLGEGGTGAFSANNALWTVGSLTRQAGAPESAWLLPGAWGSADFSLSMALTNIDADSADATGSFNITDTDGDVISGLISGAWTNLGVANSFAGGLSNVSFSQTGGDLDNRFNGSAGSSVVLAFSQPAPWIGNLIELSTTGTWFAEGDYTSTSGSVDASVVPVPVPGAIVLGMLGMGVAGLKLRRKRV